ncbi:MULTISPECIES: fatty acid desaturase family protein [unclassified Plantibacter]|uniref:fatty acid desaturase family protein n=1 Tax=unclassified Plantibacter TaxID=2624265 RepID=UPI003D34033B
MESRVILTAGLRKDPVDPKNSAYAVLSRAVKAENLLERRYAFYGMVFGVCTLALAGAVTAMVLLGDSWWQLLVAAIMGVILTQFAFLAHESAHRQIFASGTLNDKVGVVLANFVVGMSYGWWMNKHTRHHANPNTIGRDPDIEKDTISFLEEDAVESRGLVRWITQRQGYLFFPLLLLEGLNLHRHGIVAVTQKAPFKNRWLEIGLLVARFALLFWLVFTVMPIGMGFAFLGVQVAVVGLYMGASFAPNHKGMPLIPAGTRVDFLTRQILTSRNVRGSWFVDGFMGGLNYQIEHHLFPNMPRPSLRRTQQIVQQFCAENDISYTQTTVFASYGMVIRYLNRVGLAARDPFDCPMVNSFRRRD